jgi:hypothetical protein
MGDFGPEYAKINTFFKRDDHGIIIPGDVSTPEFGYLASLPWLWTEKVDGTNIRLHWNGSKVTMGGRTDNAQVPSQLIANLMDMGATSEVLWSSIFPESDDVTVYGEGYGAKIQSGGMYRPDQGLIVFDVKVGEWWLKDEDVAEIAEKLGLQTVPSVGASPPWSAWENLKTGQITSRWEGARIEGLVGRPLVDLFDRRGDRIITKMKVKDWSRYAATHQT